MASVPCFGVLVIRKSSGLRAFKVWALGLRGVRV